VADRPHGNSRRSDRRSDRRSIPIHECTPCSEEGIYFQPHLAEVDAWTKPMRLGSAVSNEYLEYISKQLAIIGDEEKMRRLQHTANMV